jgi:hypothetical protein
VAATLEQSAELADRHAERARRKGYAQYASLEVERAERAREAARRGRAHAARLR